MINNVICVTQKLFCMTILLLLLIYPFLYLYICSSCKIIKKKIFLNIINKHVIWVQFIQFFTIRCWWKSNNYYCTWFINFYFNLFWKYRSFIFSNLKIFIFCFIKGNKYWFSRLITLIYTIKSVTEVRIQLLSLHYNS